MDNPEQTAFVRSRLPWVVMAGALALYLVTLNRWASLHSLSVVAAATDSSSSVPLSAPLHYLVTLPLRLLPTGPQIIALNLLSAVFAALTLGLLARSVILLPHDRTREERHRESGEFALLSGPVAWVPPLAATLLCGLQLTFWEHATAATGEMLNLLLFAYIIRCLLEYRVDERDRWLNKVAFVYGLAITNSWAMIGYFPLAVAALVWLRGRQFFRWQFLVRLTLFGLAGLLLYLLLPILNLAAGEADVTLWQAIRVQLGYQKNVLLSVPRDITLFGALVSLVPLLLMAIRWPSSFGDTSAVGSLLANYVFRVVYYLLFLPACLLVTLGAPFAPFSPRALMESKFRNFPDAVTGYSFLTFYYLGSIVLGYILGYLFIVLGRSEERGRRRHGASRGLRTVFLAVACAAVATTIGLLAWRNFPTLRTNNGLLLREYARLLTKNLVRDHAIALCDHPYLLAATQLHLRAEGRDNSPLVVSSRGAEYTAYQRRLHEAVPALWPDFLPTNAPVQLPHAFLMAQLVSLAASNTIYYLQPSFGYYFEPLYSQPEGLAYTLHAYATNEIAAPSVPRESLEFNRRFWSETRPLVEPLLPAVRRNLADARMVGRWYSMALNSWGVLLQRAGTNDLPEAGASFDLARKLNPDNVMADMNATYNKALQAGRPTEAPSLSSANDRFGKKYRSWEDALRLNGPADHPELLRELGAILVQRGLTRQAILQFLRALELDPQDQTARIGLAAAYSAANLHDKVLATLREIRRPQTGPALSASQQFELVRLEAAALHGKGDTAGGERLLREALRQSPGTGSLANALASFYLASNRPTNALAVIDDYVKIAADPTGPLMTKALIHMQLLQYREAGQSLTQLLARNPDHPQGLLTLGALHIQMKDYTNAVPPLNHLLELDPQNAGARINRAIARLQSGQLDAARKDYAAALKIYPDHYALYYGLGEIAWRRKDTQTAIRHYETYLRLAPPDTTEAREVANRLQELRTGKR